MRNRLHTALTLAVLMSVAIAVALFYTTPIAVDQYGDFKKHVEWAAQMSATREFALPHFFFHLLTVVTASLTGARLMPAAIALAATAQGFTCLMLICMIRYKGLGLSREISMDTAIIAGFALSFVGPLSLFTFPNLYLGYPGISCAHNPTIILLRPWAVALFIVTLRLLASESWSQWRRLAVGAAALVVVGGLTKPSYNACLAPALALVLLFRFRQERSLSKISLATFAVIALSISAITLWQIRFTYGDGSDAGIMIAPLKVMSFWNHGSRGITITKLALGLAFPLFVAIAYRNAKGWASDAFALSWFATIMAIGSAYGLAETGVRSMDANLTWSMQICLLIVMAVSLAVFLSEETWFHKDDSARITWKTIFGSLLFLLHFLSGLAYIVFAPPELRV